MDDFQEMLIKGTEIDLNNGHNQKTSTPGKKTRTHVWIIPPKKMSATVGNGANATNEYRYR